MHSGEAQIIFYIKKKKRKNHFQGGNYYAPQGRIMIIYKHIRCESTNISKGQVMILKDTCILFDSLQICCKGFEYSNDLLSYIFLFGKIHTVMVGLLFS